MIKYKLPPNEPIHKFLNSFTATQIHEAYQAGAASRDAEIEALRKDAARLDFMHKHGKSNVFAIVNSWYTRQDYGMPYRKCASLRHAIDAAMNAEVK